MYLHANAKLGLAGRFALVRAIEEGLSLKAAAAAFSVSPATAHRWWHRWLEAGEEAASGRAAWPDGTDCISPNPPTSRLAGRLPRLSLSLPGPARETDRVSSLRSSV